MRPRLAAVPVLALLLVLLAAGCSSDDENERAEPNGARPVVVSAFGFSESVLLAELYAQSTERAGIPVERVTDLGSREVVQPALQQGKVDVVAEYVGTALAFLAPDGEPLADPAAVYAQAQALFARRGVVLLAPAAAQDQNGIVVLRDSARRLGLRTVSDLGPHAPRLVFGGPPECPERPFCLAGLERVYGLRFREFRALDAGGPLSVGALQGNEVDVALLFTSDGHLASDEFVLLEDDRGLQPPENVVPAVRRQVLDAHGPRLAEALDRVSSALTTEELVGLNRRVDVDGAKPAAVAADWLRRHGLA